MNFYPCNQLNRQSLKQDKEEIDAEAIKQETQVAIETLQDLQAQFEAVSNRIGFSFEDY
jgi:hypothetical protein